MSDVRRKPVERASTAREYCDAQVGEQLLSGEELSRFLELRREGRMPTVLASQGRFYVTDNPLSPWEHKKRIGVAELRGMIAARYKAFLAERAA